MPKKIAEKIPQKMKLKTYFKHKDTHLKNVKLSARDMEIILTALKEYQYTGSVSAIANSDRCDVLILTFIHHKESLENER